MIEKCHDQARNRLFHSYVHECTKQLMEKEKLSRAELKPFLSRKHR